MKKYELWFSRKANAYSFFGVEHPQKELLLEPDSVLVWTTEASDDDEAQTKKHQYLGWAPYAPEE